MDTPLYNNAVKYLPGTAVAPFFQNDRFPDCSQLLLPIADIIINFTSRNADKIQCLHFYDVDNSTVQRQCKEYVIS